MPRVARYRDALSSAGADLLDMQVILPTYGLFVSRRHVSASRPYV